LYGFGKTEVYMVAQLVEALRYKPQGGNKKQFSKKLKERLIDHREFSLRINFEHDI